MHSSKGFFQLTVVLLICVFFCGVALAQSAGATLSGTVLDQNGAVVPSVTITVLNRTTGLERRVVTNEDGSFTFPLLPPGEYVMTAQREGFATIKVPDLVVNINDQRSVKLLLKVGSINGTIEVVPAASLLQQFSGSGTVLDRQFIANLPLNGRGIQSLIDQTPGIVALGGAPASSEFGLFSVNGQRPSANYFTIDGVSAGVRSFGLFQGGGDATLALVAFGGSNSLVSADAVQEVRIQTSGYAAEYGRTPGAQVQILTRSGSNKFSGSLFEYFRNEALDAADFFHNEIFTPLPIAPLPPKSPFRLNQFGGVIGGPIIKNRTFFFASYEGLRLLQPGPVFQLDVPTLNARQSAPSQLKPILAAFPLPNGPDTTVPETAAFTAAPSNPSKLDSTSIRIDHRVNGNLSIFGRYSNAPSTIERQFPFSFSVIRIEQKAQTVTAGATWVINTGIINEALINYSKYNLSDRYSLSDIGGAIPFSDSTLVPSSAPPGNSLLDIFVGNSAFRNSIPGQSILPSTEIISGTRDSGLQRQINLVDNLSIAHNSHQLKIGVDYRYLYPHFVPGQYEQFVSFHEGVAGDTGSSPPGSLLSGIASSGFIVSNDPRTFHIINLSLYAQDSWKANRRLTLTYGLRWELNPPPRFASSQGVPTLITVSGVSNTVAIASGTEFYKTSYGNFAPRIGLSLQLSQKSGRELVLRAGAGTFYDLGYNGDNLTPAFPSQRIREFQNVAFPLDPSISAPVTTSSDPNGGLNQAFVQFDQNFQLPRTYAWNVGLEQSIGQNQVVSASYVGAAGRRLVNQQEFDIAASPPSPFLNLAFNEQFINNASSSDYNALQVRFQRRLSRGLQVIASYTLSHSIDTQPVVDGSGTVDSQRGPSDFDVRHLFTSAVSYSLPHTESGLLSTPLLRNWSFDLISRARSALPMNLMNGSFGFGGLVIPTVDIRPDLIPGVPVYLFDSSVPGGKRLNPAAFSQGPLTNVQGTLGRNALRGFPAWQIDFGVRRQLSIAERVKLQIRTEVFNIFNHPNFANPNLFPGSATFGIAQNTLSRSSILSNSFANISGLNSIGGPRSVQFALRLQF